MNYKLNDLVTTVSTQNSETELTIEIKDADLVRAACTLSIENGEGELNNVFLRHEKEDSLYEALLKEVEKLAIEKQLNYLKFSVSQSNVANMGQSNILEKFLLSSNWQKKISQNIFLLDAVKMSSNDWLQSYRLGSEFSIDSITTITSQERDQVELGRNVWYPNRFSPFQYSKVGKNSLVMRRNNELIGWCITNVAAKNILLYDNLFVKKEFWNLGRGISLFGEALKIQCEQTKIQYCTFTIDGENTPLLKLLKRRGTEYLVDFKEVKLYVKEFE